MKHSKHKASGYYCINRSLTFLNIQQNSKLQSPALKCANAVRSHIRSSNHRYFQTKWKLADSHWRDVFPELQRNRSHIVHDTNIHHGTSCPHRELATNPICYQIITKRVDHTSLQSFTRNSNYAAI